MPVIGEAAKVLRDEFKTERPEIPWRGCTASYQPITLVAAGRRNLATNRLSSVTRRQSRRQTCLIGTGSVVATVV